MAHIPRNGKWHNLILLPTGASAGKQTQQETVYVCTGCVIIFDAFLVRSPARSVIGSQTVDGCRRDPREPSRMVGGE